MKTILSVGCIALSLALVRPADAATVYIATADSAGATAGQTAALNAAIGSAIQVLNSYGFSGVHLAKSFDPNDPLGLCVNPAKVERQQAKQLQAQQLLLVQPPAARSQQLVSEAVAPPTDAAAAKAASDTALLQPDDLLLVLAVNHADQSFNKFTGTFTNDVLLNVTEVACTAKSTPQRGINDATTPSAAAAPQAPQQSLAGSVISDGWRGSTYGALIEHYNQNPVTGIASIAALLTSPWVNKHRLWLNVPTTFLDSFKHEQRSLEGTIYCATTDAMLDMLFEHHLAKIADNRAYRWSAGTWYRVAGVNHCRERQPLRPKLDDPTTESTS